MPKKAVSADELVFLFSEELRASGGYGHHARPSIAIIPDEVKGWIAITTGKQRKLFPDLDQQIAGVHTSLKRRFDLKVD